MLPPGNKIDHEVKSLADIGVLVRADRKARGRNQTDLAALLGVGRRFLSELERGEKEFIDANLMFKVLRDLGFTIRIEK